MAVSEKNSTFVHPSDKCGKNEKNNLSLPAADGGFLLLASFVGIAVGSGQRLQSPALLHGSRFHLGRGASVGERQARHDAGWRSASRAHRSE